jgi:hypothetical protein
VSALEGVSYRTIHHLSSACARARKSCVPLLASAESVSIGPTVIAGDGLCPISAAASLMQTLRFGADQLDSDHPIRFLEDCKTQRRSDAPWPEKALAAISSQKYL